MTNTVDVVAASIAAYRTGANTYTGRNCGKAAGLHTEFCALLPAEASVLDAGCGPGRDLTRFTTAGRRPVGLDACPEFVTIARRYGPVVLGDLRNLPFEDHTFAGVWACASLVHLPDPDTAVALAGLARVCATGGPIFVAVKGGSTGWHRTDVGIRWYNSWTPGRLVRAATSSGLWVRKVEQDPPFVNLWAVKP